MRSASAMFFADDRCASCGWSGVLKVITLSMAEILGTSVRNFWSTWTYPRFRCRPVSSVLSSDVMGLCFVAMRR